jgi:hypothetical protein
MPDSFHYGSNLVINPSRVVHNYVVERGWSGANKHYTKTNSKSKQSRPQLRCGTRLERCERALHQNE